MSECLRCCPITCKCGCHSDSGKCVWISAKERLPMQHQDVLTFDKSNNIAIQSFDYTLPEDGDIRAYFSDCGNWVTHWMPLPEPPHDCEKRGCFHKGTIADDIQRWYRDYCRWYNERAEIKKSPAKNE